MQNFDLTETVKKAKRLQSLCEGTLGTGTWKEKGVKVQDRKVQEPVDAEYVCKQFVKGEHWLEAVECASSQIAWDKN